MELLVFGTIVAAALGAGVFFLGRQVAAERATRWRRLAELCHLTDVEEWRSFGTDIELSGRSDGLRIRFTEYRRTNTDLGTRVLVTAEACDLAWLRLRREGLDTTIANVFG